MITEVVGSLGGLVIAALLLVMVILVCVGVVLILLAWVNGLLAARRSPAPQHRPGRNPS